MVLKKNGRASVGGEKGTRMGNGGGQLLARRAADDPKEATDRPACPRRDQVGRLPATCEMRARSSGERLIIEQRGDPSARPTSM
jgi:hypothetical protein